MTYESIDMDIRKAIDAEAEAYEVPDDLARRTVDAARDLDEPSWAERMRAWRDSRSAGGGSVTGTPRWVFAGAAAVVLAGMFFLGQSIDRTQPSSSSFGSQGGAIRPTVGAGQSGADVATTPLGATSSQKAGAPDLPERDEVSRSTTGAEPAPSTVFPQPVPPSDPGKFPPKVVRDSSIEIKVGKGRFDHAWNQANDIAAKHGGFVTNSSTEMTRGKLARGTLTARVPSDKLDAAIADFRRLGSLVRMTSSGHDVSGQLVDYDARLRALQSQEAQLLELMKQARTVSDTLEIRSRLDSVRQEIESLQAQKERLQGQVDFATIQALVYEPDAAPDDPQESGRLGRAWSRAIDAVIVIAAGFVVAAGYLGPFVILAGIVWLVVTIRRRRAAA